MCWPKGEKEVLIRSDKGRFWRVVQSWWILLTFTGLLNWMAFWYIAFAVKRKRWYAWSALYFLPYMLFYCYVAVLPTDSTVWRTGLMFLILLTGWIGSIVHAFNVRKEFLLRLENTSWQPQQEEAAVKIQIEVDIRSDNKPNASPALHSAPPLPPVQDAASPSTKSTVGIFGTSSPPEEAPNSDQAAAATPDAVNVNSASEESIAALPGVGIILAKKAIQHRQANGAFHSIDEFFELLGLKAHVIQRVRPLVTVQQTPPLPPQIGGRSMDA